jgi:hypothetical protein
MSLTNQARHVVTMDTSNSTIIVLNGNEGRQGRRKRLLIRKTSAKNMVKLLTYWGPIIKFIFNLRRTCSKASKLKELTKI